MWWESKCRLRGCSQGVCASYGGHVLSRAPRSFLAQLVPGFPNGLVIRAGGTRWFANTLQQGEQQTLMNYCPLLHSHVRLLSNPACLVSTVVSWSRSMGSEGASRWLVKDSWNLIQSAVKLLVFQGTKMSIAKYSKDEKINLKDSLWRDNMNTSTFNFISDRTRTSYGLQTYYHNNHLKYQHLLG